jgi:hypothetical protein
LGIGELRLCSAWPLLIHVSLGGMYVGAQVWSLQQEYLTDEHIYFVQSERVRILHTPLLQTESPQREAEQMQWLQQEWISCWILLTNVVLCRINLRCGESELPLNPRWSRKPFMSLVTLELI